MAFRGGQRRLSRRKSLDALGLEQGFWADEAAARGASTGDLEELAAPDTPVDKRERRRSLGTGSQQWIDDRPRESMAAVDSDDDARSTHAVLIVILVVLFVIINLVHLSLGSNAEPRKPVPVFVQEAAPLLGERLAARYAAQAAPKISSQVGSQSEKIEFLRQPLNPPLPGLASAPGMLNVAKTSLEARKFPTDVPLVENEFPKGPAADAYVRISEDLSRRHWLSRKLQLGAPPRKTGSTSFAWLHFRDVSLKQAPLTLTLFVERTNPHFLPTNRILLCGVEEPEGLPSFLSETGDAVMTEECHLTPDHVLQGGMVVRIAVPASLVRGTSLRIGAVLLEEKLARAFEAEDVEALRTGLLRPNHWEYLLAFSSEHPRSYFRPHLVAHEDMSVARARTEADLHPGGTLVVFADDLGLGAALAALHTFQDDPAVFDLLIVADAASRDTGAALQQLGYAVLQSTGEQRGLRSRWQAGYAFAKALPDSYAHVILTTSSVLLPQGAVAALVQGLQHAPTLVPMTGDLPDGERPAQRIEGICHLSKPIDSAVDVAYAHQRNQDGIAHVCGTGDAVVVPTSGQAGGEIAAIRIAEAPAELFASDVAGPTLVEQLYMAPAVSRDAFAYHRKPDEISSEAASTFAKGVGTLQAATVVGRAGVVTFAVAVAGGDGGNGGGGEPCTDGARRESLASAINWRLLEFPVPAELAEDGTVDLAGVDVLMVCRPSFDLRRARRAKSTLVTVARVSSPAADWMGRSWLPSVDLVLGDTKESAGHIAQRPPSPVTCHRRCPKTAPASDSAKLPALEWPATAAVPDIGQEPAGESNDPMAASLADLLSGEQLLPAAHGDMAERCHPVQKTHQVCFVVRTYKPQLPELTPVLRHLLGQGQEDVGVRAFVLNTDTRKDYEPEAFIAELEAEIAKVNVDLGFCGATVLVPPFAPDRYTFGYDVTDWALDTLLDAGGCTHFIFTNGDNAYSGELMAKLAPRLASKDIVAWDFETHHHRINGNTITVKIEYAFIDLGAFIVSADAVRRSGAIFLPQGMFTNDPFAADFRFVQSIAADLKARGESDRVELVHEVLLQHK